MNGRVGQKPGRSIDARILEFFANNPDEELHYGDLADKFSASRRTIHCAVWRLTKAGLLESQHIVRKATERSA